VTTTSSPRRVLAGQLAIASASDAGSSRVAVALLEVQQLVLDDLEDLARVGEEVLELADELDDRLVLVLDLLALERRQATQLHLEDGVGLDLGELEQLDERARGVDVRRGADRGDDLVEVVERDLQALEDVRSLLGAGEIELGSPADDLSPIADVVLEHPLQAERLRLAVDEGEHVGAEARLAARCA
jgi:hypothetical protein